MPTQLEARVFLLIVAAFVVFLTRMIYCVSFYCVTDVFKTLVENGFRVVFASHFFIPFLDIRCSASTSTLFFHHRSKTSGSEKRFSRELFARVVGCQGARVERVRRIYYFGGGGAFAISLLNLGLRPPSEALKLSKAVERRGRLINNSNQMCFTGFCVVGTNIGSISTRAT
jgi:hypothetical protein